jgi:hypothetical protein
MAKTKKNIKKINLKNKSKAKSKSKNKAESKKDKFINTGLTQFVYKEGNQAPQQMIIKWDNDGNNTKINMNTNIDGKNKKSTLNLSNDKIKEILGTTKVIDQPIDQRLIDDFSIMLLPPQHQEQQIILPFHEQISFITQEPIMNDIDLIEFASYRKSGSNLFSFAVMKPQIKGIPFRFNRLQVISQVFSLTLLYKSQWRTWLGLLPFILYRYAFLPFYSEAANLQIDDSYICLYESRMHASKIEVIKATRWLTI